MLSLIVLCLSSHYWIVLLPHYELVPPPASIGYVQTISNDVAGVSLVVHIKKKRLHKHRDALRGSICEEPQQIGKDKGWKECLTLFFLRFFCPQLKLVLELRHHLLCLGQLMLMRDQPCQKFQL
jgi:hypothetical protein